MHTQNTCPKTALSDAPPRSKVGYAGERTTDPTRCAESLPARVGRDRVHIGAASGGGGALVHDETAERELVEKAEARPRAVRVDGLRLKPRGEAELTPGAMVDIGLASTAFERSGPSSRGGPRSAVGETRDFYDGVFEVRRV